MEFTHKKRVLWTLSSTVQSIGSTVNEWLYESPWLLRAEFKLDVQCSDAFQFAAADKELYPLAMRFKLISISAAKFNLSTYGLQEGLGKGEIVEEDEEVCCDLFWLKTTSTTTTAKGTKARAVTGALISWVSTIECRTNGKYLDKRPIELVPKVSCPYFWVRDPDWPSNRWGSGGGSDEKNAAVNFSAQVVLMLRSPRGDWTLVVKKKPSHLVVGSISGVLVLSVSTTCLSA